MFENLQSRLSTTLRKVRGQHKLSEKNVTEAIREVRLALLEADVNYQAVKSFLDKVRERALGTEVLEGVNPGQQFVHVVNQELINMLGGGSKIADLPPSGKRVIMLVGLQGSGKTTTCAKLANQIKKDGHKPMLVAADVYRPAAIKQLQVMGEKVDVPVFSMGADADPVDIAKGGVRSALKQGLDTIIVDTAGRLHIDGDMMDEVVRVRDAIRPNWTLLVVDSMTGQDAVNQAKEFNQKLGIDGVVLTKLDGDTRGGAALSIRYVTGKPIVYAATGEKISDFEKFYPDRMAGRILGMGDVLSLVEKAQEVFDAKQAEDMQKKIMEQSFTLDDFLQQIQQMKKMGPMSKVMEMIPGMSELKSMGKAGGDDERELKQMEAIISSMTMTERENPKIIGGSRRKRIARGSGTRVQDVNRMLKQFAESKKMMKMMVSGGGFPGLGNLGGMAGMGGGNPFGGGGLPKGMELPEGMAEQMASGQDAKGGKSGKNAKGGSGKGAKPAKGGKKKKLSKEEKKLLKMLRGKGGGGGFPF